MVRFQMQSNLRSRHVANAKSELDVECIADRATTMCDSGRFDDPDSFNISGAYLLPTDGRIQYIQGVVFSESARLR